MGHSTSSGRTAPQRRLSESFGITDEQMTRRSQQLISTLTATKRIGDIRQFTIASAATNTLYNGSIFKPDTGGFVVELSTYNNGERQRIIEYQQYPNITQARNALYEATQVPKPKRGRS